MRLYGVGCKCHSAEWSFSSLFPLYKLVKVASCGEGCGPCVGTAVWDFLKAGKEGKKVAPLQPSCGVGMHFHLYILTKFL